MNRQYTVVYEDTEDKPKVIATCEGDRLIDAKAMEEYLLSIGIDPQEVIDDYLINQLAP